MIRVDAVSSGVLTAFEIRRDGQLILKTTDAVEAAEALQAMGVDEPMPLVKAAVQWGAVEIRAIDNRTGAAGKSNRSRQRVTRHPPASHRAGNDMVDC